ncbi:MAG: DUF4331 family protein [Acidimicrobiales bacterium]
MRRTFTSILGLLGLLAGLIVAANAGQAADHLDAPLVQEDGRTDLNDLYVFRSPERPRNAVLVGTVNPLAGVQNPTTFDPDAVYRFFIDTDGDARKDEHVRVTFSEVKANGRQRVNIAGSAGKARGWTGQEIRLPGGGKAMAGVYDDPFFFDFQAFQDQVKGAGGSRTFCDGHETDFFAGLNVSAIVLEVPRAKITDGSPNIGVWADTKDADGRIDRMGRPAINTVLINDGNEDRFNKTRPHRDLERFGRQVRNNLLFLSGLDGTGYTPAEAQMVTEVLLPDILTVDTSSAAGFLNGRGLADDVIDAELPIVTGSLGANDSPVLESDCVDSNDVPFSSNFPYLAPAH